VSKESKAKESKAKPDAKATKTTTATKTEALKAILDAPKAAKTQKTEALKAILDVPKAQALRMDGPRGEALKAILDAPKAARTVKAKALGIIVDSEMAQAIMSMMRKKAEPKAEPAPKAIEDAPRPQAIEDAPSSASDQKYIDALVSKREGGTSRAQLIREFREENQGREDKWIRKILAAVERQLKERKQLVVRGRSSTPRGGEAPNLGEARARSRSGGGGGSVGRTRPVVRTVRV
jgi:hypothetical protein